METPIDNPSPIPVSTSATQPLSPLPDGSKHRSRFLKGAYLVLGGIVLVWVGLVAFLLLRSKPAKNVTQTNLPAAQVKTTPTPAITPVTASNADQTLSNSDTTIQQSLNQVDS